MINKFEKIYINKNALLENIKKKVSNNNLIIEFEDDTNIDSKILDFFNSFVGISKKSIVIISNKLKNNRYLFSVVPTFQEAKDIIEIEEIERLINEE
tara:strand:- start:2059 stop:2349 length:291 start_codon:yes stop_codon:yes gene_type:complete